MSFSIPIGKYSDGTPFLLPLSESKITLFYPTEKGQFQYVFRKWIDSISENCQSAQVYVFLNNDYHLSQISTPENLTFSSFFRFEPDKSSFQKPIDFLKDLNKSLRAKKKSTTSQIHWIIEDLTPIFQSKNKQLFSLFLKLTVSEKSDSGIISGYLPFKYLLKQAIQENPSKNIDISSIPELYFTPDNLLFYRTPKSMQHIFYDADELPLS